MRSPLKKPGHNSSGACFLGKAMNTISKVAIGAFVFAGAWLAMGLIAAWSVIQFPEFWWQ